MVDGRGFLPDSYRELAAWFVAVPLLVFMGSMVYVQLNPGAPWQLEAAYSNTVGELSTVSSTGGGGEGGRGVLYLPVEDAKYLNRLYRELNSKIGDGVGETAFCIDLVGSRMSVRKAGTLKAGEDMVTWTSANCQTLFFEVDAALHFHPAYSSPVLSGPGNSAHTEFNDKSTLLESSYRISCVQAGLVTTEPGERTRALRCYAEPVSGDIGDVFPEVPVWIAGG